MNGWTPLARGQHKVNAVVTRKKKESDRGAMAIIIRDHDGFYIGATCNVIELIALREETCAQAVYQAIEFAADLGS